MTEKNKEELFVVLKQPIEFRRNSLEAMKVLIKSLQRYEKFRELRSTKTELTDHMRSLIRDIDSLAGKLKLKLPKLSITKQEIDKFKKEFAKNEKQAERAPAPSTPESKSEIDMLEEQLNSIEQQLSGLK